MHFLQSHIHWGGKKVMREMPLCVQQNISEMQCLHLEREIDAEHLFSLQNSVFNSHASHAGKVHEKTSIKSYVIMPILAKQRDSLAFCCCCFFKHRRIFGLV